LASFGGLYTVGNRVMQIEFLKDRTPKQNGGSPKYFLFVEARNTKKLQKK
jgi:hypothetical protein